MKYKSTSEKGTSVCEHPHGQSAAKRPASAEARAHLRKTLLDQAFEVYCGLVETGNAPDRAEFLARYPDIADSLARSLSVAVHVHGDPEFYSDEPVNWPHAGELYLGFQLERELGRGAFSHVFVASEPALGNRKVVVKISKLGAGEALTLGRLEHANIAPVHSVASNANDKLAAICMPYLGEATLNALLARLRRHGVPRRAQVILDAACTGGAADQQLPAPGAAQSAALLGQCSYVAGVRHLARQLLDALIFIHARGVTHRDLKPSNVLLANGGVPMLLDFNLSGDICRSDARFGGTPIYMPPEQLELMATAEADDADFDFDPRSDLFSVGVILYELLTGEHPFAPPGHGTALPRMRCELLWNQEAGARPVRALNPSVDRALAQLIDRCLAYAPADRPESASAALALLPPTSPPRVAGPRRAALIVLLASALAGGLLWSVGSYPGDRAVPAPASDRHSAVAVPLSELQRGQEAYARKEYELAIKHLGRHLVDNDKDASAWFTRGLALLKLGEHDRARFALAAGDFAEAYRVRPDGPAKACEGYALQQSHRLDEARQCYEKAERAGEGSACLLNNLGVIHLSSLRYADAERCFNRALELAPRLQVAYHNRGRMHLMQAKPASKKVSSVAGPALVPAPSEQHFLGLALRDISQAMELGPPSAELYHEAATLFVRLSRYDPALRDRALGCLDLALQYGLPPQQLERDLFKSALAGHGCFDDLRKRPPTEHCAKAQYLAAIPGD